MFHLKRSNLGTEVYRLTSGQLGTKKLEKLGPDYLVYLVPVCNTWPPRGRAG